MPARNWTLGPLGLALGAVLAAGAPAALAAPAAPGPGGQQPARAAAALRAPLPGGLGPCLGSRCPDPFPPVEVDTEPNGYDEAVNIFVGDDFLVRERAAEAEGKVVVLGSFDQNKNLAEAGGGYNIGIVGAGSLERPPAGSDFLTTGRDVTIATGQRLISDGGVVRHAGTAPGPGTVTGPLVADPAAITPYAGLRDRLTAASRCYARVDGGPRPATGTAVNENGTTVLTGDNTSDLQVFNVDFDMVSATGGAIGIRFDRIPADATVLVNVLGAGRTISTYGGTINDTGPSADPWNGYRTRLLWNFPDATEVQLTGSGQFQGSVLVGERTSRTVVTLPGTNGRFLTTGELIHTSTGGGGQEFHAYPFNGDLPDCGEQGPTVGQVSVLKQDDADRPLAGATYELWHETNDVAGLQRTGADPDEKFPDSCTTDAQGNCTVRLPVGERYYWLETQAPAGYGLPADPVIPFDLDEGDVETGIIVNVPNEKPAEPEYDGTIKVLKKDAKTKNPLRGAVFEVWKETNSTRGLQTRGINPDRKVTAGCATDRAGVCSFPDLDEGWYYVVETAVPEGYVLPPNRVTGPLHLDESTPGHRVVITLENKRDDHGKGGKGKGPKPRPTA
ncbi:choice-of-anchor A family protein [Streptomyces sp. H34-S4]|uniref:choice-of-anchor A family protein n=1 Tax=Streptomyces sp. H34-S4 TaxID=2996463 RepID=UPI002271B728|nr:choice-of-anchor A family protein [Streptomyces sp. H34-S4]MCY0933513.1 choice-of-anchor A family protein [Streptomyces sp. H34-S4]